MILRQGKPRMDLAMLRLDYNFNNLIFVGGDEEEFLLLGLRLSEGVTHLRYRQRFGHNIPENIIRKAKRLVPSGYVKADNLGIALTTKGFLVSNAVIAELLS